VADAWLSELERLLTTASPTNRLVLVAAAAGRTIQLDAGETRAVVRRSLLLHAAGGDAQRPYELDGRAVVAAAGELDTPERRAELAHGLHRLGPEASGLPSLEGALETLVAEPDLAWRAYACAVLLEAREEED
jgi:hypothetical protein